MRGLTLAIACALFACGTESIELVDIGPHDADASTQDAEPEDMGTPDTGVEDLGVEDLGTRDAEPEDLGMTRDAEPEDLGTPDSGVECVCRRLNCVDDPTCVAAIGAGSTCVRTACTRFTSTCSTTAECAPDLTCTQGEDSVDDCR